MKVQARITLPRELRRGIDDLRAEWDPQRAAGNPAHVTIAYQDEAPDAGLLARRLRLAVAGIVPFCLTVGAAVRFPEPIRGAFLTVADPTGGVAAIRDQVLTPPFTRRSRFGLHVTLLHPDQGWRLESAWSVLENLSPVGSFEVTAVQLVGAGNELLETIPFADPPAKPGGLLS